MTNDFLGMRKAGGGVIADENFMRQESKVLMSIERQENQLQSIRRILDEDDKVSQYIKQTINRESGEDVSEGSEKKVNMQMRQ